MADWPAGLHVSLPGLSAFGSGTGDAAGHAAASLSRSMRGNTMSETTMLRHVVMFGFKDGTTAAEIDEIVRRFAGLKDEVPDIEAFEYGENNSPERLNDGLSHCFLLTFPSTQARDAYLPHPR
ncbi:MAG: Dabb family protein, partial [Pseudomonadota bacterium]